MKCNKTIQKLNKLSQRGCLCSITCIAGMLSMVSPPVFASPVTVYECQVVLPQNPLPIDSLDLKFTIRRHVIDNEPIENAETSLWSQAKFENNGTFELDIYPLEGPVRKEFSTGTFTTILDGGDTIQDELDDKATGTTEAVEFEGFVVESISLVFVRDDGTAWSDHLTYPEITDPTLFNTPGCLVEWRAPGNGAVCQVPGGGSTLCKTGTYIGIVRSIRTEDHEQDHGGGSSVTINAGMNDAWVNADAERQGMFITVYPDVGLVFLAWFTFDTVPPAIGTTATFGSPDQRWVTAVGSFSGGTVELKAELTSGGLFNSTEPLPIQTPEYGTINLDFKDCNEAMVEFDFPSVGESGEFTINRVLPENAALCEALTTQ
jgi:hypothetical protein